MKNPIPQLAFVIIAFVALTFLMSYTRPAADEPRQYVLVSGHSDIKSGKDKFEAEVSQKLAEGWHLQGGISFGPTNIYNQAMVK